MCIRWCWIRCALWIKLFPHSLHLWGLSPVEGFCGVGDFAEIHPLWRSCPSISLMGIPCFLSNLPWCSWPSPKSWTGDTFLWSLPVGSMSTSENSEIFFLTFSLYSYFFYCRLQKSRGNENVIGPFTEEKETSRKERIIRWNYDLIGTKEGGEHVCALVSVQWTR